MKDSLKKLLHIDDLPERTALAFAIGIFLGFSPFLGLHTLVGLGIAFLFGLNRIAVLVGVWINGPWSIVPYYMAATWIGTRITRCRLPGATIREIFQLGLDHGFLSFKFFGCVASQWGFLLSFGIGSLILCLLLGMIAYPLSLLVIRLYHARRK